MKKSAFIAIVFVLGLFSVMAEDSIPIDTYFTKNIMLNSIIYTSKGYILVYYSGNDVKEIYLPNRFFAEGKVKIVLDDDVSSAMQANVIYKNGKAFKVKIYTTKKAEGRGYKIMDVISDEVRQKFDTLEDLTFEY